MLALPLALNVVHIDAFDEALQAYIGADNLLGALLIEAVADFVETLFEAGEVVVEMERLNSVDLETLNEAIVNLNATVEPLARFFGK